MSVGYTKKYDVVVAGAGVAGVAAALAAARRGHRVALVEKQTLIGGLATSGLIFIYLPLCDGKGTQVTFGISEELLKLSLKYSPFDLPPAWGGPGDGTHVCPGERYQTCFSPAGFTIAMDEALRAADVDLWLDTMVCATNAASDGKVTSLVVENSSGRGRIEAKCFVDATGDATLVRRAGGAFATEANYRTPWVMEASPNTELYPIADSFHIQVLGSWTPEFEVRNAENSKVATQFTRDVWQMCREFYDNNYRAGSSDRHRNFPVHLPAMPQFRKVARIMGVETLSANQHATCFESSIGLYADWRKPGFVWETPYGTLLPRDVRGVLAAGRCISTDGDAWEVYRVIPSAAMTGEAAGIGAALAGERGCDPLELSAEDLRRELRNNHFKFHLAEVGL